MRRRSIPFPIGPAHPLMIPAITFHVAQTQEAQAKTPFALLKHAPDQVNGNLGIFRGQSCLVTIAGEADTECQTRPCVTDPSKVNGLLRHLAPQRWLHHYFPAPPG